MKCVSNYVAGKTRSLALNLGLPVPESFLIPSGSSVSLMSITLLAGGRGGLGLVGLPLLPSDHAHLLLLP